MFYYHYCDFQSDDYIPEGAKENLGIIKEEEKLYWSREILSAEFVKAIKFAQNYFWRALEITISFLN
jgi:hypothetical protein